MKSMEFHQHALMNILEKKLQKHPIILTLGEKHMSKFSDEN